MQAEADAEETGGGSRRGRRSAAAAASAAMSYLSTAEDQVDSVYFGTRKMGPPPAVRFLIFFFIRFMFILFRL